LAVEDASKIVPLILLGTGAILIVVGGIVAALGARK